MKAVYPGSFVALKYDGIIADYVNEQKIDVIIRGIRGSTDLDIEIKLEQFNSKVCKAETVYLTPETRHLNTSSTLVRMFIDSQKVNDISAFVSEKAFTYIQSVLEN